VREVEPMLTVPAEVEEADEADEVDGVTLWGLHMGCRAAPALTGQEIRPTPGPPIVPSGAARYNNFGL